MPNHEFTVKNNTSTRDDIFPASQPMHNDDEIDLRELFSVIWKGKWLIILFTVVFAIAAVAYALSKPNIYTSSVLLAPATEEGGGMSALASQFGGLASLAGVNLGSGSSSKTDLAIAVLKSRQFLMNFMNEHNLKIALFAGEKWDINSGELLLDNEIYNVQQKKWVREVDPGKSPEPTDWEAFKAFSEIISVTTDKENGLVTLNVEFLSPILAKQWVEWLVKDINEQMRQTDSLEVDRNIAFLRENLETTNLADMRTVFYQLIEDQLKTKMLSQVNVEYAFKTIDPAVVAEEKSKPKRALICVLGTLLGGMLGVMLVLLRHFINSNKIED